MKRRVQGAAGFDRDIAAQIAYLIDQDRGAWVELLARDIRELEEVLSEFAAVGQLIRTDGRDEIRRIGLRHAPFRAWYRMDREDPRAPVELLRLFHVRQRSGRTFP